ncbi:hypothetical protein BJX68DRAFT_37265 [Aspergillus pseudodeflectus]|uniref:Uncharacterized protein n=1 Tax=Aspergillus pseudodeflectus TaxID=176178 RepID=A0ABR4J8R0_9EURO
MPSPPIVESVALWKSDNGTGLPRHPPNLRHFCYWRTGFPIPGWRMGTRATVQLKRPSAETGTTAEGRRVAPTGICMRAVHRRHRLAASDRLVSSTGISPRETRLLVLVESTGCLSQSGSPKEGREENGAEHSFPT